MVVPAQDVRVLHFDVFFFIVLTLSRTSDQIEMGLFVLRYISCLLMFLLGLKAPGITQNINYFTLNDSTRNLPPQVRHFSLQQIV